MAKTLHHPIPTAAHDTVIDVSVRASKRAAHRLMAAIAAGGRRFSIVNGDGSLSIAATLSTDRAPSIEELLLPDGVMVVDWERGTIARNGRRAELSRTELRLLGCLLEHRGEAVSRDQLVAMLWPAASFGCDAHGGGRQNALAVYVCFLRRKLKAIGLGTQLRTVRRTGYALAI